MSGPLCLRVEVPVCAFRPYASREYQDTYPVPTPSSVYGMLLSLIGVPREEKDRHRGVRMALALEREPSRAKVFRKLRRGDGMAGEKGTRPDYQDLLIDLQLWVWLDHGNDRESPPLSERVRSVLADRGTGTCRTGGLSLGESSYLVDSITAARAPVKPLFFVVPDKAGFFSLPVWVDHADATRTLTPRFRVEEDARNANDALPEAWFFIGEQPP
jgi:CRISPR-associated protein Cas5/DevS